MGNISPATVATFKSYANAALGMAGTAVSAEHWPTVLNFLETHPALFGTETGNGANGPCFLHECCIKGHFDKLDELAARGVAVPYDLRNRAGYTPLLLMIRTNQNFDCILSLLQRGVNVEATVEAPGTPEHGYTAFHLLHYMSNRDYNMPRHLAECGADIEAENAKGETPLKTATTLKQPNLVVALLKAGARAGVDTANIDKPEFAGNAAAAFYDNSAMGDPISPARSTHLNSLQNWFAHGAKAYNQRRQQAIPPRKSDLLDEDNYINDDCYAMMSLGLLDRLFTAERCGGMDKMIETVQQLPINVRRTIDLVDDERESPTARPQSAVARYARGHTHAVERH